MQIKDMKWAENDHLSSGPGGGDNNKRQIDDIDDGDDSLDLP